MSTSDGLDKIEPADKKAYARAAVLTDIVKPKMAWGHFVKVGERKSHIRCLSVRYNKHVIIKKGLCCQKLEGDDDQKAQLTFAVLAVKYLNADPTSGKYLPINNPGPNEVKEYAPIRWELGWIKLSRAGFKSISELAEEDEQVFNFDFTISFRATGIGYEYKKISRVARYRQLPELMAEVEAAALPFKDGALLIKRLGKKVTELELRTMLTGQKTGGGEKSGRLDDTDDL